MENRQGTGGQEKISGKVKKRYVLTISRFRISIYD